MRDHCRMQAVSSWTNTEAWQNWIKTWIDLLQQPLKGVGNLVIKCFHQVTESTEDCYSGDKSKVRKTWRGGCQLGRKNQQEIERHVGMSPTQSHKDGWLLKLNISSALWWRHGTQSSHGLTSMSALLILLYFSTQHPLSQHWILYIPALSTLYPSTQHLDFHMTVGGGDILFSGLWDENKYIAKSELKRRTKTL